MFYIDSILELGGDGGTFMTEHDVKQKVLEALEKYKEFYCKDKRLIDAQAHEIAFDSDNGFVLYNADEPTSLKPYKGGMFTASLKISSTKPKGYEGLYLADVFCSIKCISFDISYSVDDFEVVLPQQIQISIN